MAYGRRVVRSRDAAARQSTGTYARSASGVEASAPGFESRHLHSPARSSNRGQIEGRVDLLSAGHADLVDERLQQPLAGGPPASVTSRTDGEFLAPGFQPGEALGGLLDALAVGVVRHGARLEGAEVALQPHPDSPKPLAGILKDAGISRVEFLRLL